MESMSKKHKLFTSVSLVVVVAALGVFGTFAAFTATTTNTGNQISSGTVKIDQHAGATTIYNVTDQKPGQVTTKCIRIAYTGSLAASVKLYTTSTITSGTDYTLTVNRGSGLTAPDATMNCSGFTSGSTAYTGDLGGFATTYAGGYDGKAAGAAWALNDTVDYQFVVTPKDDAVANNHTTTRTSGATTYVWEARNN